MTPPTVPREQDPMTTILYRVGHHGWTFIAKDPKKPTIRKHLVASWQKGEATEFQVWTKRRGLSV